MMTLHPTWLVTWQGETRALIGLRVSEPHLDGLLSTLRMNGVKSFSAHLENHGPEAPDG
jgi:hypothetical protein